MSHSFLAQHVVAHKPKQIKCECLYNEKPENYHDITSADTHIAPPRLALARSHPMWLRNKHRHKKVYNEQHIKLHDA